MTQEDEHTSKANPVPMRDPTKLPVTEKRARYLSKLARVDEKMLAGKTVAQANELLRWRVDPELLLFRRVCGQVVKRNPATGGFCPVPGATVHVEDTDCSFLGLFPVESPLFWLFPITCHREEIATVTTDACGRFCVFLPFWDIDRILRFRRIRICFLDLFRPRLRDIIELLPDPPIVRFPRPLPDPPPINVIKPEVIELVRTHFGADTAGRLEVATQMAEFGAPAAEYMSLIDTLLPSSPPPIPSRLPVEPRAALREAAEVAGLDAEVALKVDFKRFIGPFIRCRDLIVAEWVPFLDIPDITFRVTQDVDGDGVEEVIYSEGFFDVRWNAGPLPDVTLEANANAICVPICEPVDPIPCEDQPVISTAGYMTLEDSHHNDADGYGRRVNRPVPPPGDYPPPPATGAGLATAVSPYAGTLNLHGCHRLLDATHYRLTYVLNGIGGPVPFTGISWWAPRSAAAPGPPIHVSPDPEGWYPILDAAIVEHPSWLLYWNTRLLPNGTYEVRLEVGVPGPGGMTVIATSDPRKFTVDNSEPEASFLWIRWRYVDEAEWHELPLVCPVITRDGVRAIRVQVRWQATSAHLRNGQITFIGCGAANPILVEPVEDYRHWHTHDGDNTVLQTNQFELPAGAAPGCYTLWLHAASRAFNPSGFDHGPGHDWLINQTFKWRWVSRAISVV